MDSKQPLLPAYALSAIVVVAAVLGSLVVMETATIRLVVPASRLVANLTLKGGPHGRDLITTTISADVTDSLQGTASTVQVSAKWAFGTVQFWCSPACPGNQVKVPMKTFVTNKSEIYQTQTAITVGTTPVSVAVFANDPGLQGNTGANTVTTIAAGQTDPNPNTLFPAQLHVNNPAAITGGAKETTGQVIQQSDLDRVQLGLTAKVTQDLDAALRAQAGGLGYLADGQPAIKLTSDHMVGDHVDSFTMTATATQSATAFSQAQADAILRTALNQKLPKGFALTADPIQTTYQAQKPTAAGDVTITATGTGVIVPNVTASELKARIRGMQVDAARRQLQQLAPGTTVDITIRPAVPWLPVLQDHINLTYVVVSPA